MLRSVVNNSKLEYGPSFRFCLVNINSILTKKYQPHRIPQFFSLLKMTCRVLAELAMSLSLCLELTFCKSNKTTVALETIIATFFR